MGFTVKTALYALHENILFTFTFHTTVCVLVIRVKMWAVFLLHPVEKN